MARKSKEVERISSGVTAEITDQAITDTIRTNFMPYAMYVIRDRAIPEIDGLKPSHRKLLYTMYKMGLLTGGLTKSANIVGQTMKLNPHGDMAIYETMVRLTRGNEALLHPFVESKGNFGKQYSRDMAFAAPRYTEAKLAPICSEIFRGIDKDAVDMVPNYDNTMTEPALLPTTFPNILVSPNMGIAVGIASQICSFNLAEVCDGTIQLLRHPNTTAERMLELIKAPDFTGGGYLVYDREKLLDIYKTGKGSFTLRARYNYDKSQNCIDIIQIPYSTSIEQIMNKVTEMVKEGKLKEITDFRNEIDLTGFKLTIDLKNGVDPDALMAKLFKNTSLQDNFSCNFNVLINGTPKQLGIIDILREWILFRVDSVRRELTFELGKKRDKLHLLRALGKILLDIDKAIKIIRETEHEVDVVPRLMEGFKIDQVQAEYIAEIKLRHLNREYIITRIKEIESLQGEIAELEDIISDELKIKALIIGQLQEIKKKYGIPRRTQLLDPSEIVQEDESSDTENYECRIILTEQGYFKKTTMISLKRSEEHRFKEGDRIRNSYDTDNLAEIMVFSDKCQCYKAKADDFEPVKASLLGDFLPAKLGFDEG
ncbi:MAG: topoisomerase IV, partial [Clostridia bacterium]|nr:topoisomerase IV [Clostridia bacterium]